MRSKFKTSNDITLGPQLNSCIDEALRMSPAVGGSLWREIGPGGMTIDSIDLPAGVDVGTGICSLHHNKYHREPFKYMPERWMAGESGSTKESVELARSAFVPFSTGPRSCVGKGFAYHDMMLTLARIVRRFEFCRDLQPGEVPNRQADEFLLRDHVTGAKDGPFLPFAVRNE